MGIIAFCPNGHRIKVKDELAGRKGICPTCAARFRIPKPSAAPQRPAGGTAAAGPPTARVVSVDPMFAATLPSAYALDDAETVDAARADGGPADVAPDFVLLDDDVATASGDIDDPPPAAHAETVARVDTVAAGAHEAVEEPAPPHTLLDDRPDLAWCVAVRGGAPSTPIDAAAMRAWIASGEASADHVVWRQDWPDWRPVQEVFPEAVRSDADGWP